MMATDTVRRRKILLFVCACLSAYFGYHAIQGRHGLVARSSLIERSRVLEREIRALEAVQARLTREIALLSETRPDPDYVDELAREMLGFAHPSDKLIVERPRGVAGR